MRGSFRVFFAALVASAVAMLAMSSIAVADQGTVVKWSQPPVPMDPMPGQQPMTFGENYPSDIDWRNVPMTSPPPPPNTVWPPEPNWNVADDFVSDGRPILTVRWWGSYFSPNAEPQLDPATGAAFTFEEGYVLSFFSDIPADLNPAGSFSQPGDLLGTYVAPIGVVKIKPTNMVGWDMHRIWEYEVNLQDTHLFHPSEIADPIAFREQKDVIYWLSVVAENGAVLNPATWEFDHLPETQDPIPPDHFWGWHTRPHYFNDVPTESHLWMPPSLDGTGGQDWVYDAWHPIRPQHQVPADMTFELLTVPEPASAALLVLALTAALGWRRRA